MDLATLVMAIASFVLTLGVAYLAFRARSAAESARTVLRQSISMGDLSQASAQIDEIKELHQRGDWQRALDRYTPLRRSLIEARSRYPDLPAGRSELFQRAISQLGLIENTVRGSLSKDEEPGVSRYNKVLLEVQTTLDEVRAELEQLVGTGE